MSFLELRDVGWVEIIKRTFKAFGEDDMDSYAAALAYRAMFALFPFLLFLITLIGFLDVPEFFDWLRDQAAAALPSQATEQVDSVVENLGERRGGLMSLGVLIAIWTSSIGIRSLMNALNNAYNVQEARPIWKVMPLAVLYTIGIAIILLCAAAFMILGPQAMEWLASHAGFEQTFITIWTWIRWPLAILLQMLLVAVIYYLGPNVEQEFRFITPGSVMAVLVWILATWAFGYYVGNFSDYDAVYGSIGAVIVLMLYFYISAAVLLLGAEMNAVIEHASEQGKDDGEKEVHD